MDNIQNKLIKNQKGMTLIEIMIVLVILGGLMGILATQVMPRLFKSQRKEAEIQIKEVSKALDLFYTDCGFYPNTTQGLKSLLEGPPECKNWGPDPYLKKGLLKDPWGSELAYESNGATYTVRSFGRDHQEGGSGLDEDISSKICSNSRGLTLIEILVVLAIMAGLAVFVVPRLESTNSKMKRVVRNVTVAIKRLHHLSRLKHQNYRLAIQFADETSRDKRVQSFWVEASSRNVLFTTKEQEEEIQKRIKKQDEEESSDGFAPDTTFYKKPQVLPAGIFIDDVEFGDRVVNSGRANILFLSAGVVQEAAIHISDHKTIHWTLFIHPLTGQADAVEGHVALKDLRQE